MRVKADDYQMRNQSQFGDENKIKFYASKLLPYSIKEDN